MRVIEQHRWLCSEPSDDDDEVETVGPSGRRRRDDAASEPTPRWTSLAAVSREGGDRATSPAALTAALASALDDMQQHKPIRRRVRSGGGDAKGGRAAEGGPTALSMAHVLQRHREAVR